MSIFGVGIRDLQSKLMPGAVDADRAFVIGNGELSEADAAEIIDRAEARLIANLDPRYHRLLTHVDGEILTKAANGTQTVWTTSFHPVTDAHLYVDFPDDLLWESRSADYEETDGFTMDAATGVITFAQAPIRGTRLYVDYHHAGAGTILHLRDLVVNIAVVEISRRFAYFRTADGFDRFTQWETQTDKLLANLRFRDIGVAQLDDLDLVYDDTDESQFSVLVRERNPLYSRPISRNIV